MRKAVLFPVLLILSGCATSFREDHYFKSVSQNPDDPTNYFRLRVSGSAQLSGARYIAGFYDERAVDLFFDEMKSASSQDEAKIESLFQGGEITLGDDQKISPLSPTPENGVFLMIFSTNAKAVANTIGEFAESQVVADAVTNLVNRDDLKADARATQVEDQRVKAFAAELETLVGALPTGDANDAAAKEASLQGTLRILSAIAQTQGHAGSFSTLEEARGWFAARSGGNS